MPPTRRRTSGRGPAPPPPLPPASATELSASHITVVVEDDDAPTATTPSFYREGDANVLATSSSSTYHVPHASTGPRETSGAVKPIANAKEGREATDDEASQNERLAVSPSTITTTTADEIRSAFVALSQGRPPPPGTARAPRTSFTFVSSLSSTTSASTSQVEAPPPPPPPPLHSTQSTACVSSTAGTAACAKPSGRAVGDAVIDIDAEDDSEGRAMRRSSDNVADVANAHNAPCHVGGPGHQAGTSSPSLRVGTTMTPQCSPTPLLPFSPTPIDHLQSPAATTMDSSCTSSSTPLGSARGGGGGQRGSSHHASTSEVGEGSLTKAPHEAVCASPAVGVQKESTPTTATSGKAVVVVEAFAGLDESQRTAACMDPSAPLLIQAGAGSGKTQTMACRIAYLLLCGVPAYHILGICFTRQAAETLRGRVEAVLPPSLQHCARALKLKTLHAFGLECLRRFGRIGAETEVYDAGRQRQLARRVVDAYAVHHKSAEAVADLVDYVNRVKAKRELPPAQVSPDVQDAYLFRFYQQALHEVHNAVDFGDLQQLFCAMLRPVSAGDEQAQPNTGGNDSAPTATAAVLVPSAECQSLRAHYTHIVVDEFQDFNEVQFEILALLAGDACRVTCVGDPNQCIYAWRGAMPNVFAAWKRRFPQTEMRVLAVNYRSDGCIVSATNRLVKAAQHAYHSRRQRLVTLVTCQSEADTALAVPFVIEHLLRRRESQMGYGDIAVLCRTRRRVSAYYALLQDHRIPVRELKGVSPDHITVLRALLAYLRLCFAPHVDADVRTVLALAPAHLSTAARKSFFMSLDAVCSERRAEEQARVAQWRHGPSTALSTSTQTHEVSLPFCGDGDGAVGVRPQTYSYYAVLRDLVFHNFSAELFPKLQLSKPSQNVLRRFIRTTVQAQDVLSASSSHLHSCFDAVEQVIRYVCIEGGFDVESGGPRSGGGGGRKRQAGMSADASTARTAFRKRGRGAATSIADALAEEYSNGNSGGGGGGATVTGTAVAAAGGTSQAAPPSTDSAKPSVVRAVGSSAPPSMATTSSSLSAACGGGGAARGRDDGVSEYAALDSLYDSTEEEALLAEGPASFQSLLLRALYTVRDLMEGEVAEEENVRNQKAKEEEEEGGGGSGRAGGTSKKRATTAAMVLRRTLDEFVTVLPSDDFGSLGDAKSVPLMDSSAHAVTRSPTRDAAQAANGAGNPHNNEEEEDGKGDVYDENGKKCSTSSSSSGSTTVVGGGNGRPHQQPPQQQPLKCSTHTVGSATGVGVYRGAGQVTVGTVHKAKGMEWPAVIVPGCWTGEFPIRTRSEEEKRVFYVAMSRAMTDLVLITALHSGEGSGAGSEGTSLLQQYSADAEHHHHHHSMNGDEDKGNVGHHSVAKAMRPRVAVDAYASGSGPCGQQLQRTPYLAELEEELEMVSFEELQRDHMKSQGML